MLDADDSAPLIDSIPFVRQVGVRYLMVKILDFLAPLVVVDDADKILNCLKMELLNIRK